MHTQGAQVSRYMHPAVKMCTQSAGCTLNFEHCNKISWQIIGPHFPSCCCLKLCNTQEEWLVTPSVSRGMSRGGQRPYIIDTMHSYTLPCNAYLSCAYPYWQVALQSAVIANTLDWLARPLVAEISCALIVHYRFSAECTVSLIWGLWGGVSPTFFV